MKQTKPKRLMAGMYTFRGWMIIKSSTMFPGYSWYIRPTGEKGRGYEEPARSLKRAVEDLSDVD
jgi:hypothetical protein